ncbi:MAG: GDSL-type esterase/lipase family protein [Neptuniibacter sp.]
MPDKSVIFIGDSITLGLAVAAVANSSVNYGIGSDTTVGVLRRLPVYKSIKKASAVVIAIGINDMKFRSNENILSNIQTIGEFFPDDVPVIFSAVLPIDERVRTDRPGRNISRIKPLNAALKKWTETYDNFFYADAGPQLIDESGNLAGRFHEGDGVHLNSYGNAIWIRVLREVIDIAQQ